MRLTDVIYPNLRDVSYGYSPGSTDDVLSRVATIGGSDGTYAEYTYLGADTIVTENFPQAQVKLDYSANNYSGFDRFGDVANQVWEGYGSGNTGTLDGFSYAYDPSGNVLSETNMTQAVMNELFTYDNVDRLTSLTRGTGTPTTWNLDSLGNDLNTGTYTASNEKTPSGGSASYDLAGNMTGDGTQTYVYDAWDRLDQVGNGSGIVAQYSYDGAGRLVEELSGFVTVGSTPYPTAVAYDYYDGQNAIETRAATFTAGTTPTYAWRPRRSINTSIRCWARRRRFWPNSAFDGNVPQPAGRSLLHNRRQLERDGGVERLRRGAGALHLHGLRQRDDILRQLVYRFDVCRFFSEEHGAVREHDT